MALGLRENKLERGDVEIVKGVGNKGATVVSAMVPAAERGHRCRDSQDNDSYLGAL